MTLANVILQVPVNKDTDSYFEVIVQYVLDNMKSTYRETIFEYTNSILLIIHKPTSGVYYGNFKSKFIRRLRIEILVQANAAYKIRITP